MVLHYLQQQHVVPVLQEMFFTPTKPVRLVDGWNTWFFDDLENLDMIWPFRNSNTKSVAELFLGFLRYYSEEFNFEERVVCCRQFKPLTRLEKMWTGKKLAIEGKNPFMSCHKCY